MNEYHINPTHKPIFGGNDMSYCPACGTQIPENSVFCPNCGTSLTGAPVPVGYAASSPSRGLFREVFSKSLSFLFKKPILLWGLSLLGSLLTFLALALCWGLPLLGYAIAFVLQLGMTAVYLEGYRGKSVSSTQFFSGFNKNFFRNAGGMAWRSLWILIWCLIPVVGFIFAIIKSYAYRFVPYIMLSEPEIPATEALKKSIAQTRGYKGSMFAADLVVGLAVLVIGVVLGLLTRIPYAGILFMIIAAIFGLIVMFLLPLLMGIIHAAFYDEITKRNS